MNQHDYFRKGLHALFPNFFFHMDEFGQVQKWVDPFAIEPKSSFTQNLG
jgi:hypothetical protein